MIKYTETCFSQAHIALQETIEETPEDKYTTEVSMFVRRLMRNLDKIRSYD